MIQAGNFIYSYIYLGIFVIDFIILMILIATKNKKMDRTHWSIVLLLQFCNFGYFELSIAKTLEQAVIGNTLIYLGGTILPAIFIVSLFQAMDITVPIIVKYILYLFTLFMLATIRFGTDNGLYYYDLQVIQTPNGTVIDYVPGIMFRVHDAYVVLLMLVVLVAFLYAKKTNKKSKKIIARGFLIIALLMAAGYSFNFLVEIDFLIIPVVYMVSLVIASICFKLSNRFDVREVVSDLQESTELIHGYLLVNDQYLNLGATEKALEMIPDLDKVKLQDTRGEYSNELTDIGNLISRMIYNHRNGIDEEEIFPMDDSFYELKVRDCDAAMNEKHKRYLFEITDVTARQKYIEIVNDYNSKLEKEVQIQTEQIRELAIKDRVTNAFSTYGFVLEIEKKIKNKTAKDYDAYYMDIVRMGQYNRKYGNPVGDQIILQFVDALKEFADKDEVIGRLGGNFFVAIIRRERRDEFLALLQSTNVSVDTFEGPQDISVTCVAGVYEIREEDKSHEPIMTNISMAVSLAKNRLKKSFVIMTPELMEKLEMQRQLMETIPKCMELGEFKPFYQPKVNVRKNSMCGAEALARWEHDGQLIPPIRFIPLLEQNEFICKMDFYMLDYVCADIRKWIDAGLNPPVISVNFSRKNLGNPILAEEIYNVVKSHDIPPHLIQIEVTETIDEFPLSYLKGVVEAIQRYGMSAAIDDFGTGSSSINLIKEISFDVIKIDKSFIDKITEKDTKILELVIAMAKQIGADVITEGTETKEQVELVMSLGCDKAQGYYFDKPLPRVEFEERMQRESYCE